MYNQLKKLHGKIKKKKIIAFDTETYGETNEFILGTIYTDNETKTFRNKEEMQTYLISQDTKVYIVASNLEFDFNVLFYNTKYYYKFKPIINGSTLIAEIYQKYDEHKLYFIDSYNYFKSSVETYGKILGIQKITKPKFLGQYPKTEEEWKELETYCMRDSEITYKIVNLIQDGINVSGGQLKLTIASSSIDTYKRKYLSKTLNSEEQKFMNINEKLFKAYYGGRTEIFSRGYIKNYNYLDYNSMYPSVMLNEYPDVNTVKFVNQPDKLILEYEGVSSVLLECPYMHIPLLPVQSDKLIFPIGTIRGEYTHIELRKAEEQGYKIKKIYWSIYYTKTFYPFKEYILEMYHKRNELKKEGNSLQLVYKLLMNSLYGKFAQKNMTEIEFINLEDEEQKQEVLNKYPRGEYYINKENKGYVIQKGICKSSFVRPIFSIYTTAMSRIKIQNDLIKYKGIYCDTDSIVTKKDIPDSNILGELKKELYIKRGIYVKPKMYSIVTSENEEVTRLKGIPKATINTFESILNGKNVQYMKFSHMKESHSKCISPNTKLIVSKKISLEDNKRIWNQKFNPYIFDDYSKPYIVKMR